MTADDFEHDDRYRFDTPVRTQPDLESWWRNLMEPLGFSSGAWWALAIDPDDLPSKVLMEIRDDGVEPTPNQAAAVGAHLAQLTPAIPDGSRWALLRCRAGLGGASSADVELAAALVTECRQSGIPTDVVHLATDDTLVPLTYDELAAAR